MSVGAWRPSKEEVDATILGAPTSMRGDESLASLIAGIHACMKKVASTTVRIHVPSPNEVVGTTFAIDSIEHGSRHLIRFMTTFGVDYTFFIVDAMGHAVVPYLRGPPWMMAICTDGSGEMNDGVSPKAARDFATFPKDIRDAICIPAGD